MKIDGYQPGQNPPFRITKKYWAADLSGVWARSPFLHNGSVRTMQELLTPSASRPQSFHRGSHAYDTQKMGYTDAGNFLFKATGKGNANTGHDYGTNLSDEEKRLLIEYLKTL